MLPYGMFLRLTQSFLCADTSRPLKSDGRSDIEGYNDQLAPGDEYSWLSCPWMLGECYLYRYIFLYYLFLYI